MKKILNFMIVTLLLVSSFSTCISADEPLGSIDNPYPSGTNGCTLTIDGDNYTIACENDILAVSNDTNYFLTLLDSSNNEYQFDITKAIVKEADNKSLTFTKDGLEKANSSSYAPEGEYTVLLNLTRYYEGGSDKKYYSLSNGKINMSQIKNPLPNGLNISFNDVEQQIEITCADSDACKTYLNKLKDTSIAIPRPNYKQNYDNSYVELWRAIPSMNGGQNLYTLPQFGEYGVEIFINESVDDCKLVITSDTLLNNRLDTNDIEYIPSINVIGYPTFSGSNIKVNVTQKSVANISASVSFEPNTYRMIIQFGDNTPSDYLSNVNEVIFDSKVINSSFGFGLPKDDSAPEGQGPKRSTYVDESKKQIIFSYMDYYSWTRGKGDLRILNSLYETLKIEDIELTNTCTGQNPDTLYFSLNTKGLAIISNDRGWLSYIVDPELSKDIPEMYRGRLGQTFIQFRRPNGRGGQQLQVDTSNLAIEKFKDNEYMIMVPFEQFEGKLSINQFPTACLNITVPLRSGVGDSPETNIKNWYDMSVMLNEMLEGESAKTDTDLENAINNAGIKLDSEVEDSSNANVSSPSYLAQIVDVVNKNGKGFSQEELGEGGRVIVTVDIKSTNQDLTDDLTGLDVTQLKETGISFEIDVLNKYFADAVSQVPNRTEEITELIIPIEFLFDIPLEELLDNQEYKLLTEHNGEKKLIDVMIVGNQGMVKIKEFSPFQLVIVDKKTDTTGTPNITCAGSNDKNCDGVVTCDEIKGAGWTWNNTKGVCEFTGKPTVYVVDTATK